MNLKHNNVLLTSQSLKYELSKQDKYNIDCYIVSKNIKYEDQFIA